MICTPACITDALPQFGTIGTCGDITSFRSGEIPYIGFVKCNSTFTDIEDPAEWAAKKAAGEITILPVGSGNIGEKSATQTKRINCQNITTKCETPFEFRSAIIDSTTQAEWALYNQVETKAAYLLPFFVTCDNHLLVNPDYVTGGNIGIDKKSMIVSQVLSGEEDSDMEYSIKGVLTNCKSLKVVKMDATLAAEVVG